MILTTFTLTAILLRRGAPIRQYLAIRKADWRAVFPGLVLGAAVGLVVGWMRLPPATEADVRTLDQDLFAAYFFLLAFVVPIMEEALFRGFAIAGFLTSRLGATLPVPLSAALWSFAHDAPSWTHYAGLFVFGCVLGALRIRSDSILPPLALHALLNVVTVGAVVVLRAL